MEQRIKLTTTSTFDLERDEIKRLYTYLSLFQYRFLRIPNYREELLFEYLEKDLKKYCVEIRQITELNPNNLMLNKIRTFFDTHHRKSKEIVEEQREREMCCNL